ncbi:MAG TPA: OadG family protein [Epulopiscium sp.]|nr:OadG family protein [Candidatus Epulonipiscium sp.]
MNLLQNISVVGAQKVGLVEGLSTFIVGISVVFLALILLVILLEISGKIFANIDKKAAAEKASAQVLAPVVVEPTIVETTEVDDLELIAVITATIAATMGTSVEGLQVRSLRKTNNVWGMSGRSEQLYN